LQACQGKRGAGGAAILKDHLTEFARERGFSGYAELRGQSNAQQRVVLLQGSLTANSSQTSGGFSARVRRGGSYGFASSPDYTPEGIGRMLAAAEENAGFLDGRERLGLPEFARVPPLREEPRASGEEPAQKDLIAFAAGADEILRKRCAKLVSRFVGASTLTMEKVLLTSDGVFSHSVTPRSICFVGMTAEGADGAPVELSEPFGGFGRFGEVFSDPERDLAEGIDRLYGQVLGKAGGARAEPGRKQVILDADLAGILAHEAVGHTVEADFVLSGSVGGPNLGKQVASEMVTLVDFASEALGQRCPVPVYVDDEGTPARDAVLIEGGVLRSFMHNKESAARFGHEALGNARAFAYSDEPLIRMRNTCVLPGRDRLEDMIAATGDGYYFVKSGNGQADATGEFMFGVTLGYEIKNGKLGRPLRDTTISGVAFDVLKTVDMLSGDMKWTCSGMCGKKQPIPVGMGGPAIRAFVNVG